jgi:hydroxymethylglutaryl-CoA lyase
MELRDRKMDGSEQRRGAADGYDEAMPERVRITDVSPRDGLQNEPGVIPTSDKVRLIELLAAAGVDEIEATSFVSPKWVPQLGDAGVVCRALAGLAGDVVLSVLVPNERGLEGVMEVNRSTGRRLIGKVGVFTAASEEFSRRNTNAGIDESIKRFVPVVQGAKHEGLAVRGYVSCVVACPFEGAIAPGKVAEVCARLKEIGVDELDLGDTIGAGTPETVRAVLREVGKVWALRDARGSLRTGAGMLTLHLHDTFGRAAECVRAALEEGVRSFDGSAGGLGGCPYAGTKERPAAGNIATEALVRTVEEAGFETGVDIGRLVDAGVFARRIVGRAREAAANSGGA